MTLSPSSAGSRPNQRRHTTLLQLDENELASRRALFELGDDDLARLAALRPFAERNLETIVDEFYELLLEHPESKSFLVDESVLQRVKRMQKAYFLGLFDGRCDVAYLEDRLRVGVAHEKIGIVPKLYIGAYRRYLYLILKYLERDFSDTSFVHQAFSSIQKLVYLDISLAMDAYIAAHLQTIREQRAAIRELSTPVTQIHDGILLVPLVGEIDNERANQLTERVLGAVVREGATAVILDIAGVPTIDTRVADHLLKTTAAIRCLGARTILSGISPQVAQSIVSLGVDMSSLQTVARLKEAIARAQEHVAKRA